MLLLYLFNKFKISTTHLKQNRVLLYAIKNFKYNAICLLLKKSYLNLNNIINILPFQYNTSNNDQKLGKC